MDEMHLISELALLVREGAPRLTGKASDLDLTRTFIAKTIEQKLKRPSSGVQGLNLRESALTEIMSFLDDWDEQNEPVEKIEVGLNDIIGFRYANLAMNTRTPFSVAFGLAHSRPACVDSSVQLFGKLLKRQGDGAEALKFEMLVPIAAAHKRGRLSLYVSPYISKSKKEGLGVEETQEEEEEPFEKEKIKRLVDLFRPDKDATISLLDFVRSIDGVYKKLRLLSRSIENATAIDRAYEQLINVGFYLVLIAITCSLVGVDAIGLIGFLSSFIISLAFMIGSATALYFEGILLILVRRPYEVSRCNISLLLLMGAATLYTS
jgi:hypothetical protein